MKSLKLCSIFLIFLVLINTLYANTEALEKVSIQLKWFNQYQFAGIFMAKEKGLYARAGLDVTIKERNPKFNNIQQVIDGESQYGVADSVILRYRAQGKPVRVLATIFQHNAMVLITKKESGIVSPYEMRNKRISYQQGLDDSIISSLLSFANIDKDDYIKAPMDFSHMNFVRGEVDVSEAYLSIEPYWMKKRHGIEVNVIDPKNYGIDFYGDLIFTTQSEIDNHPDRVEAFKLATLQGWAYALAHQDETIKTILEKYNTRTLTYDQLLYEARVTENLIASKYITLGDVKKSRFSVLATLYSGHGISNKKLNEAVETIIYDPAAKVNVVEAYLYPILYGSLVLLFLLLVLIVYNRRLTFLVRQRTRELEHSKEEAIHAANAKSAFLANMSHEIRTPMNAVLGFSEQLSFDETDPKRKDMFRTIQNSGQMLLTIINDILDISKIESGKMALDIQVCNMKIFFDEVFALFEQGTQEKCISYSMDIDSALPRLLRVDEIRLKQIMINILSNAIKFTPKEGKVSINVRFLDEQKMIQITIIDSGVGIAKENQSKIFNAFEQEDSSTTRNFGGTGLGLAISLKLITMMRGTITLESELGKGSTFIIILPHLEVQEGEKAINEHQEAQEAVVLSGRVLIVEDVAMNQILMETILDNLEVESEIAENRLEAVALFEQGKQYGLIFMDEQMPVMNGVETAKKIREIEQKKGLPAIPIIAVSANVQGSDKERFIQAGMNESLAKPYSQEMIAKLLSKYMNR
jgi:signal transduction histidine kinase